MADKATTITDAHGRPVGSRGSESGKDAKYSALEEKQAREAYRRSKGASGIGGARKASTPEFKAGEDAHIATWKKQRAALKAKKAGQRKAATKVGDKKPE